MMHLKQDISSDFRHYLIQFWIGQCGRKCVIYYNIVIVIYFSVIEYRYIVTFIHLTTNIFSTSTGRPMSTDARLQRLPPVVRLSQFQRQRCPSRASPSNDRSASSNSGVWPKRVQGARVQVLFRLHAPQPVREHGDAGLLSQVRQAVWLVTSGSYNCRAGPGCNSCRCRNPM